MLCDHHLSPDLTFFKALLMTIQPDIHYIGVSDSTNKELWRRLDANARLPEFTVVQAGMQTAGRGLGDTSWESESGKNLLFSLLLKPAFLDPAAQFMLNKAISLGIREALANFCPQLNVRIKWPNDLYVAGKKIGGTLVENRIMGKTMEATVAGTGINVNQSHFPESLPNPSSLKLLNEKTFEVAEVLHRILSAVHKHYHMLQEGHWDVIDALYLEHLLGYGERNTFMADGEMFTAEITGIDAFGKLLLRDIYGQARAYGLKEVAMKH